MLILFFLKKIIDLKIKTNIKRKSNSIVSKFFEIGLTLNIFKFNRKFFDIIRITKYFLTVTYKEFV